jgi:hypothetical protein
MFQYTKVLGVLEFGEEMLQIGNTVLQVNQFQMEKKHNHFTLQKVDQIHFG